MLKYDLKRPPDPKEWLALDEGQRTNLIAGYHGSAGEKLPNPQLYAICHTIVENQIAMGEEILVRNIRRLMKEGLDRHEASHAVGSVLVEQIYHPLHAGSPDADINKRYARKPESLTAEK